MAQITIKLTDEELEQINGGITVIKEIHYNDKIIKTAINNAAGIICNTNGKDDPGNNPIFFMK